MISGQTIEGHLPDGTPFGSMSGLMFDCLPAAIRRKSILRGGESAASDYRQRYFNIAVRALADPALSVLATPNPSTILKLLEVIRGEYALLLEALSGETRGGCLPPFEKLPISSTRLSQLRVFIGQE